MSDIYNRTLKKGLLAAIIGVRGESNGMARLWVCVIGWLAGLVAVAFLIPILAPPGSADNAVLIAGCLVALQVSGLGIAAYSGVLCWKSRQAPRLALRYAMPPIVIVAGFFALGPLMALSHAAVH